MIMEPRSHLVEKSVQIEVSCDANECNPEHIPNPSIELKHAVTRRKRSGDELKCWMERMRGRCEVLESVPTSSVADALWNDNCAPRAEGFILESDPTPSVADACAGVAIPQEPGLAKELQLPEISSVASGSAVASQAPETWRTRVHSGQPLPRNLRIYVWAEQLQVSRFVGRDASLQSTQIPLPALIDLLQTSHDPVASVNTTTDGGHDLCSRLALAFAERYLAWLSCEHVFHQLVALLRYHRPNVASHLDATLAGADEGLSKLFEKAWSGPVGIAQLLLDATRQEPDSVALLCDRLVMEARDNLLLFVLIVLMGEAPSATNASTECLSSWLQSDAVATLSTSGLQGTSHFMEQACLLCDSTPLSLCSSFALTKAVVTCPDFPICEVTPDELLTHVYETPSSTWRLVVVDVRTAAEAFALPLCMRLSPTQDRLAVLQSLPYEDSIHLCLVADSAPTWGDDALELCRQLTGPPTYRKHLSVAGGGWPQVIDLAESLGLELFPLDVDGEAANGSSLRSGVAAAGRKFLSTLGLR